MFQITRLCSNKVLFQLNAINLRNFKYIQKSLKSQFHHSKNKYNTGFILQQWTITFNFKWDIQAHLLYLYLKYWNKSYCQRHKSHIRHISQFFLRHSQSSESQCPSLLSKLCYNTLTKTDLAYTSRSQFILRVARAGTQGKNRTWTTTARWLSPVACAQSAFLYNPEPAAGVAPRTVGSLPHASATKKMPPKHSHRPIW